MVNFYYMQIVASIINLALFVGFIAGMIGVPLGLVRAIVHFLEKKPARQDILLSLKAFGLFVGVMVLWMVINIAFQFFGIKAPAKPF